MWKIHIFHIMTFSISLGWLWKHVDNLSCWMLLDCGFLCEGLISVSPFALLTESNSKLRYFNNINKRLASSTTQKFHKKKWAVSGSIVLCQVNCCPDVSEHLIILLMLDALSLCLCAGDVCVCLYQLFVLVDHSVDWVLVNQEVVTVNVSKHRHWCSAAYGVFGQ